LGSPTGKASSLGGCSARSPPPAWTAARWPGPPVAGRCGRPDGGAAQAARLADPDHPVIIEAAGPLLVRVDPLAVSRILGNLLDNAATHSPKGAPIRLAANKHGTHCWPSSTKGP
jgi:hypothetical protein